jgi:O-antigen ligase
MTLPRILLGVMLLAVAWGALAFGAVYPWAYTPLMAAVAVLGIIALATDRERRVPTLGLAAGFAAIGVTILLQLVPLPHGVLSRVSPGTDRFLSAYDLAYRLAVSGAAAAIDAGAPGPISRPISLVPDKTMLGFFLFAALALFLLGAMHIVSKVGAQAVVRGLVIMGALLAIVAIAQHALSGGETYKLKIYGFWTPRYRASPFGPFVNRNHFAGWTLMVLPFALTSAYSAFFSERRPGMKARHVIAWLSSSPSAARMQLMTLAAIVMVLAILMSDSRSGMTAMGAGFVLTAAAFARKQSSRRARVATIVALAAIVLAVGLWAGVDRLTTRAASVSGDLSSAGGRLGVWRDALRIIGDFPSAGTGVDTFGHAMILYQSGDRVLRFQEAHNDYLQLASEGGLLVGIPIVATLLLIVRQVRQRFREAPKDGTTYWLRVAAVIALASIALQSLVEFSLQMPGNAVLFVVVLAIALHRSPNLRVSRSSNADDAARAMAEYGAAPSR